MFYGRKMRPPEFDLSCAEDSCADNTTKLRMKRKCTCTERILWFFAASRKSGVCNVAGNFQIRPRRQYLWRTTWNDEYCLVGCNEPSFPERTNEAALPHLVNCGIFEACGGFLSHLSEPSPVPRERPPDFRLFGKKHRAPSFCAGLTENTGQSIVTIAALSTCWSHSNDRNLRGKIFSRIHLWRLRWKEGICLERGFV